MKRSIFTLCLSVLVLFIWTGCQKDDLDNATQTTEFVSATPLGTFTKAQLTHRADSGGYGAFDAMIKYDVAYYKIVYQMNYNGRTLLVSGLLGIPQNVSKTPSLLCAQHGTMFRYTDAPSNFPNSFNGFPLMASVGYITLMPDYIGFGASKDVPQTYYSQQYSASCVVNMIKAVQDFLTKKQIASSGRLFLLGYSEGGYVTMAAQKEIETNPSLNLEITAAAEGAGGYDLSLFMNHLVQSPTYPAPSFLALIIQSYKSMYGWDHDFDYYFQEPYASKIPNLLAGFETRFQIDSALTDTLANFFNPDFLAQLKDTTLVTPLKEKMTENSFLTWVPTSPTRLFHGTDDHLVPFETSQVTFDRFQSEGANNVQFFPIQGGTHVTSVLPMMANVLPWFASLDN